MDFIILFSSIDKFEYLVKSAQESKVTDFLDEPEQNTPAHAPVHTPTSTITPITTPTPTPTSTPEPVVQRTDTTGLDIAEKIQFIKEHGKQIGPTSYYLDIGGGKGNEFVLGGRYRKINFDATVHNTEKRADMGDYNKAVAHVIEYINMEPSLSDIRNNRPAMERFLFNIMGKKGIEGSRSNYCFGNIQVAKEERPEGRWTGNVMILGDKNYTVDGEEVPYVELYKSFNNYRDGFFYWLDYLKKRNMLEYAKLSPAEFTNSLRRGLYFGAVRNADGSINEAETDKKERKYLDGILVMGGSSRTQAAIKSELDKYFANSAS